MNEQVPSKERLAAIRARHTTATGGNCLTPGGYTSHCEVCELFAFMDEQSSLEPPAARPRATCEGCGFLINPQACKCTLSIHEHGRAGHVFTPMGCECPPYSPAPPPAVSNNPNEGPIGDHGFVEIPDGVLPAFHNHWSCSQCGRRAEYVRENGCPESCGRTALTKGEG